MKRNFIKIVSVALAATLLTATAGTAAPRNNNYNRAPRVQTHSNNNAAALGFGLFALGLLAVVASQNNQRNDNRYYAPPPPPPPPPPRYRDSYGPPADYYDGRYDQRYDNNGYGNGYDR